MQRVFTTLWVVAFGFLILGCSDSEECDDCDDDDVADDDDVGDDDIGDDDSSGSEDLDGDGWTVSDGDCDDSDPDIHPDATEVCDGADNDCDGEVDQGVLETVYEDADGDGHGNADVEEQGCSAFDGWSLESDDCNDQNPNIFPGNAEVCDGLDNNCDDEIDEGVMGTNIGVNGGFETGGGSFPENWSPFWMAMTGSCGNDSVEWVWEDTDVYSGQRALKVGNDCNPLDGSMWMELSGAFDSSAYTVGDDLFVAFWVANDILLYDEMTIDVAREVTGYAMLEDREGFYHRAVGPFQLAANDNGSLVINWGDTATNNGWMYGEVIIDDVVVYSCN